jgi:hypothetical protein
MTSIRCHVCGADPAGRWKPPPKLIFHDPYAEGAGADPRGFLYACRDHLSERREEEIQTREKGLGWKTGGLRSGRAGG